jgi:quercetin dioxygenase-like cupin family protein
LETWDISTLDVEPHLPQVLRSDDEGRIIVINLPAGEELGEHQVHERSWIIVLEGEIELESSPAGNAKGGPGFLIHARPNERHEIRAVTDARLIMLLVPWPGEGHPSQRAAQSKSSP